MSLGPDEFLARAHGSHDTPQQWEFSQMFGEDDETSQDESTDNWISSLAFDSTGAYLAVGYNCGQVVILYQEDEHTYQLCCEFKSHNSEFDCLTSTEIEEKINAIEWYPFGGRNPQLMTCNDKTIKLFRVAMPHADHEAGFPTARPRRVFQGGHAFNINSLAFNSDGETFISTDDLTINLWNIEIASEAFNIVNIKPENMETLQEVITRSDFHPTSCNLFVYATSKGIMRMGDLRDSSLCDRPCKEFSDPAGAMGGFFEELVATISDCKFSPNGHFLLSRDYLSMKVWDLRKGNEPLQRIKFHEHLIPKLCDLYESDNIFDKFGCCWSGNSTQVMSGSYNGDFYICDAFQSGNITQLTLKANDSTWGQFDTSNKALHLDWHPKQDIISVGAKDCGYIYVRKDNVEDEG